MSVLFYIAYSLPDTSSYRESVSSSLFCIWRSCEQIHSPCEFWRCVKIDWPRVMHVRTYPMVYQAHRNHFMALWLSWQRRWSHQRS